VVALLMGVGMPASAATHVVTTTADSGPGSLRQAMTQAIASPEDDGIVFDPAADGVITLQSALPDLLSSGGDLTITGNGAASTLVDGAGQYRLFKAEWQDDLHFTLRSLTLRNGYANELQGGAIYIVGGSSTSLLAIDAVEFVDNEATYDGGAIYTHTPTVIDNSLFEGNVAGTHAAAIYADGSALLVSNSTITGNNADGGIIRVVGVGVENGPVSRLVNLTVAGNQTHFGVVRVWNEGRVSLSNSLIAGNTYGHFGSDLTIDAGGHFEPATSFNNVIGREVDSGIQNGVNGNQVGVTNPLVGPSGFYGGQTRTAPLLPGSPALDAGTSAGGDIPASDQRGVARVGAVDVGAFESHGFTLDLAGGDSQSTAVNTPFADPLKVTVAAVDSLEPVAGGAVQFSAPASGASAVFAEPAAIIGSDGTAQVVAIANGVVGGPYVVTASLSATQSIDFSLTNTAGVCGAFTFPYTLSGADNTARVAELRQALECANVNATADEIDLGDNTLVFSDAPYTDANGTNALPIVTDTLILANGALERDASAPAFRFLDVAADSDLTVRAMQLHNGLSDSEGGAIRADGALTLQDNVFEDNRASTRGGAVATHAMTNISTSRFARNAAVDGAAIAGGDDDAIPGGDVTIVINSRFEDNGDDASGSVIWNKSYFGMIGSLVAGNHLTAAGSSLMFFHNDTAVAELRNVTIAGNTVQGALLSRTSGSVQLHNGIVWDNQYGSLGSVSPTHSLLPGFAGVNGNLDQPPGFVGTPGDYHLDAGSSAIDAGDNSYGSFEDLDLNPRPLDDAGVADTGNGDAPIIDMGAYEYQTDSVAAGIAVTPTSGLVTTEAGGTATFTVVLDRYPAADVTLPLSSSNSAEGLVVPTSLGFTQANWNQPQTVTVVGLNDGVIDGDQDYTIVTGPASSADPAYDGIDPPDVSVVNEEDEIPPHSVGGTVIGLLGNGLVLSLDDGVETLPVAADGSFAFATMLTFGEAYSVTIDTQPQAPAQACVVINGSGTMAGDDVGSVVVNCGSSVTYAVGGTLSGLAGGLTLQLNGGGDLPLSADGSYVFLPRLVDGAAYVVTVGTQPQNQLCALANATGTVTGADVANVDVNCAPLLAELQLGVDDGHEFARYGHVRDYFVTLGNTGNVAANGVAVVGTFSAAFDVPNVHWQCLGGASLCGSDGAAGFSDTANLPANSSVTWIVSVPVLAGSDETDATFTVDLPTGTGLSDADTDTLVIFRDGVDVPYGDGTQALDDVEPLSLPSEHSVAIEWPPASDEGIRVVRVLQTPDGKVEVQRLNPGGADFVRLLGVDRVGQQHASEWARVADGARLVVGRVAGAGNTSIVLLEGAARSLALPQGARENTGEVE
jgi:hypothetical protein